jgi:uncharacterized protein (DUF924 family)
MATVAIPEDVLSFWLGPLDEGGLATSAFARRWFEKDDNFDHDIRERFELTFQAAMAGELQSWLDFAHGRLAYVLVLDQFPRNMYRSTHRAFTGDSRALAAAKLSIEVGHDRVLRGDERIFMYMPFMHAEELATQERCVALFTAFRDESTGQLRERLEENVAYAVRHRDTIARWGRFPHRNVALDRTSTAAEVAFLAHAGSSF